MSVANPVPQDSPPNSSFFHQKPLIAIYRALGRQAVACGWDSGSGNQSSRLGFVQVLWH